jgi:adenine-specific DNA-methyltransferase
LRERNKEQVSRYTNPDNHPKGPWTSGDLMANIKGGRYVHSLYFPIINPKTGEEHYPSSNGNWRFNREKIQKLLDNNEIYFGENGTGRPKLKRFLSDVKQGITYTTLWDFVPFNTQGSKEMTELLGNLAIFDNPKPVGLMLELLRLGSDEESIVLDFFAGSCSISQAVMRINTEDTGKRKYICIQLPEPCPEDSQASKADFKNVAEIGKERIRRASKKIAKDSEGKFDFKDCKLDLGFKVFKLGESNFKIWRTDIDSPEVLEQQMELFVDNTKPDTLQENVLYELIVKAGLDLNVSVEKKTVNRKDYFLVDGGRRVVCLENKITQPLVDKILEYKPEKVICLDKSFEGNDQLKTNTALQTEAEKIDFKVI